MRQIIVATALALASLPAAAQTRAQYRVLDSIAEAMVAAEKCPQLRLNSTAAAIVMTQAGINPESENTKMLLSGRMMAGRMMWDIDRDPRACEKVRQGSTLLQLR